jgi:pimeloyl-ACP methyl ester carboxylesterase
VLLNAMVPRPGETFNEWWEAVGVPEQEDWDEQRLFFHDVPADVVAELTARGEPDQSDRPCAEVWPLDAWPDVPTSAITGRDDRLFPESLQRAYLRDRLGIEPTVIDGGHLVALSNPEGLAAALLA